MNKNKLFTLTFLTLAIALFSTSANCMKQENIPQELFANQIFKQMINDSKCNQGYINEAIAKYNSSGKNEAIAFCLRQIQRFQDNRVTEQQVLRTFYQLPANLQNEKCKSIFNLIQQGRYLPALDLIKRAEQEEAAELERVRKFAEEIEEMERKEKEQDFDTQLAAALQDADNGVTYPHNSEQDEQDEALARWLQENGDGQPTPAPHGDEEYARSLEENDVYQTFPSEDADNNDELFAQWLQEHPEFIQ